MNKERESHFVPALIAVVGVVAFAVLIYLFLYGANWVIGRLFGINTGTPF